MYLTRLALTDFRCYVAADLAFTPGVTVLSGGNGEGKTNLAEAIGYVATLGSHRVATDAPLVRVGARRAVIRASVAADRGAALVEIEVNPGATNRVRLNRVPLPRPRQVLGVFRTVLFAPEDLALVKGDPDQRRRFLDELLVATAPRYAEVRADYDRVLRQRTALLKTARPASTGTRAGRSRRRADGTVPAGAGQDQGRAEPDRADRDGAERGGRSATAPRAGPSLPPAAAATLDAWDDQLARAGAELVAGRTALVAALRSHVVAGYAAVSGGRGRVDLRYRPSFEQFGAAAAIDGAAIDGAPGDGVRGAAPPGAGAAAPVAAALVNGAGIDGGVGPAGRSGACDLPTTATSADRTAIEAALRSALTAARPRELERGVCLVGPHRDDLDLRIGELPARGYASQGESWSLALALRLAAFELLRADSDDPVLILDDVFAELDVDRRDRLARLVSGAEQVLVTAAVPGDVPAVLAGARFEVTGGTVTRVG